MEVDNEGDVKKKDTAEEKKDKKDMKERWRVVEK